jgi:hypothetical protein
VLPGPPASVEVRYLDAGDVEFRDRTDAGVAKAGFEKAHDAVEGVEDAGGEHIFSCLSLVVIDLERETEYKQCKGRERKKCKTNGGEKDKDADDVCAKKNIVCLLSPEIGGGENDNVDADQCY